MDINPAITENFKGAGLSGEVRDITDYFNFQAAVEAVSKV